MLNGICRNTDLKRNGIIVNGVITDYGFPAKSAVMNFDYEFYYNGTKYTDNSYAGVKSPRDFIGKSFPVRFSPKTKRSEILVVPKMFKKYGIAFPDSLSWVNKFVIKGI